VNIGDRVKATVRLWSGGGTGSRKVSYGETSGVLVEIQDPGPLVAKRTHLVRLDSPILGLDKMWFDPSELRISNSETSSSSGGRTAG
jgi:hypothetical protein